MLLLLHIQHRSILKRPLHHIRLRARPLHMLGCGKLGPEIVEVLQFDQVPDVGERGGDDGGFGDGGRGGDTRGHFELAA